MEAQPYHPPAASALDYPPHVETGQRRMEDDAGMRLLLPVGRSLWAIAAGYLGLFSVLIIFAPFSLFISLIAILDIRRSRKIGKPKYGMGRAVFGLVMGFLFTLPLGFLLVALIADAITPSP